MRHREEKNIMAMDHVCSIMLLSYKQLHLTCKYCTAFFMFQTLNKCLQQSKKIFTFHHLLFFLTGCLCSYVLCKTGINRFNLKDRCGIQLKVIKWIQKKSEVPNPVNISDHVPSTYVPPVVMSYTRISRSPSQLKR